MKRYPIIDALRFILAFWVVMGHSVGMFPIFAGADESNRVAHLLSHFWSTVVWGTPAVIVFFVISGFCIHLPFQNVNKLPVLRFYGRRYIRILIPVAASLVIYRFLVGPFQIFGLHSILWDSVLWSVLCEEIYYFLYPVVLETRKRYGWKP